MTRSSEPFVGSGHGGALERPPHDAILDRVDAPVTAFAGDGARAFLRGANPSGYVCVDGAARPSRLRVGTLLRIARLGAFVRRRQTALAGDPLGLDGLHGERCCDLGPEERRRVAIGVALAAGATGLVVVPAEAESRNLRRETWTLLRWVRDAAKVRVLYVADGTAELDDLADELVVLQGGRSFGPDEPWGLLGRTLRGSFAETFLVESLLGAAVDYLDEDGRWLRVALDAAGQEVYLPFVRLSPGWRGRIAVRPDAVLVLREPLRDRPGTNQLRGRIAEVGDLYGRRRVDVDLGGGEFLRAAVEEDTVRELGIRPGVEVVCAFEPAAVRWAGQAPYGSGA